MEEVIAKMCNIGRIIYNTVVKNRFGSWSTKYTSLRLRDDKCGTRNALRQTSNAHCTQKRFCVLFRFHYITNNIVVWLQVHSVSF